MQEMLDANRDTLSALDAATGDGDHGVNLATSASLALTEAVHEALDQPWMPPSRQRSLKPSERLSLTRWAVRRAQFLARFSCRGSKAITR